ncbi:type I-E CRISPR-associated protein Cse2/CasB [Streptomyces angustmyceticus]|uniref:type I-E CRISPR-associated protein Cse2/CasB n=1 Tax=Streptomyces angustmyceticus TaxID=285578 RepID=UPI0037F7900F
MSGPPPSDTNGPLDTYDSFLNDVRRLCASTGDRAALRRAVAAATRPESTSGRRGTGEALYLLRALAAATMHPERKQNFLLVAGLLAQHPETPKVDVQDPAVRYADGNLGAALGRAVTTNGVTQGRGDQTMRAFTRKTTPGLRLALPRAVRHLDPSLSGLDLAVVLSDLNGWHFRAANISRRWWESYALHCPNSPKGI